jgi:hypothetical protein
MGARESIEEEAASDKLAQVSTTRRLRRRFLAWSSRLRSRGWIYARAREVNEEGKRAQDSAAHGEESDVYILVRYLDRPTDERARINGQ